MTLIQLPYVKGSDTSREAAHAKLATASTEIARVYRALVAAGPHGKTDDELQVELDMDPSTQRPRRVELVRKDLVVDSGTKRLTRSRRRATVWIVAGDDQMSLF